MGTMSCLSIEDKVYGSNLADNYQEDFPRSTGRTVLGKIELAQNRM